MCYCTDCYDSVPYFSSMMMVAPIPSKASKANIWSFAENAARNLGLERGGALEPLVGRIGGTIEYKSPTRNEGRLPESIIVRTRRDFTIFLPVMTSPLRDRFTIAHELGHFFLHFPIVEKQCPGEVMIATRWVDEKDADLQRAEWEANWFAAAFLMPKTDFLNTHGRVSDLSRLAALFGVSQRAAEIRLKSLNA